MVRRMHKYVENSVSLLIMQSRTVAAEFGGEDISIVGLEEERLVNIQFS